MRYSPKPQKDYAAAVSGLIDTPERWNLAWLSHDWGKGHPKDPNYTVLVRRTTQCKLDGSGPMLVPGPDPTVADMLGLPAPRFAYLIKDHAALPSLPLFQAYGQKWLEAINQRAKDCWYDGLGLQVEDVPQCDEANKALAEIRGRPG